MSKKSFQRALYFVARLYWRIRRPVTLGSRVLLVRGGRVLLVRLSYVDGWYLPGGGVNAGESFREGALRELREECAIEALEAKFSGLYFNSKEGKADHVALYLVTESRDIPGAKPDSEIDEVAFFDPKELPAQTSPATRRRIGEFFSGTSVLDGTW